jgi:pimeloyl-ACP methyl ester carboxylesterase
MIDMPQAPVDFIEAGDAGPLVMLVHSSVAGARQWRRLMDALKDRFHVRAVNLYGYGKTPPWTSERAQTLADQARLVEAALPPGAEEIALVGHSFGGSVAMAAAARLGPRVRKLMLFETNPVYLLKQAGRDAAFAEAKALRDCIKTNGARGDWIAAAEVFADYWGGPGTWRDTPPERQAAFTEALKPNFHEWDAVMDETIPAAEWAARLPRETLLVSDPETVLPIRELMTLLRAAAPGWAHRAVPGAGHMAPLTKPELVNPIVAEWLES